MTEKNNNFAFNLNQEVLFSGTDQLGFIIDRVHTKDLGNLYRIGIQFDIECGVYGWFCEHAILKHERRYYER